jgi:hypothetical protein
VVACQAVDRRGDVRLDEPEPPDRGAGAGLELLLEAGDRHVQFSAHPLQAGDAHLGAHRRDQAARRIAVPASST